MNNTNDIIEQNDEDITTVKAPPSPEHTLSSAIKSTGRVKFALKKQQTDYSAYILLALVIAAGVLVLSFSQKTAVVITVSVIIFGAAAFGIAYEVRAQVLLSRSKKHYYCCYVRGEGEFCLAVTDRTYLFFNGKGYLAEKDGGLTVLDEHAYAEWWDGISAGFLAAAHAKKTEFVGNCVHFTLGESEHYFDIKNGVINSVQSAVPVRLISRDEKSGAQKYAKVMYTKYSPTYDFELSIPFYAVNALKANSITLPEWIADQIAQN